MKRANDFGFTPTTSLNDGIQKTIEWYLNG